MFKKRDTKCFLHPTDAAGITLLYVIKLKKKTLKLPWKHCLAFNLFFIPTYFLQWYYIYIIYKSTHMMICDAFSFRNSLYHTWQHIYDHVGSTTHSCAIWVHYCPTKCTHTLTKLPKKTTFYLFCGINYPLDFIISYRGNYIKKKIAGTGSIMHALGQRPSIGHKEMACTHTHTNTLTYMWSCGPSVHLTA